jgi:hypothetical protein
MIWRTEFRHGVIADPRQCRDILSRADVLDRRIGQRDHLSVVADLVHLAKTRIQIEQLGDRAQPLSDILNARRNPRHFLKEPLGENMRIDVDGTVPSITSYPRVYGTGPRGRASAKPQGRRERSEGK